MRYKKIKVAVLMGGRSPEYEISLISGSEVVRNLNEKKYEVFPIIISRDGSRWQLIGKKQLLVLPNPLNLKSENRNILRKNEGELKDVKEISNEIDIAFIAIHGLSGEDGTIQGMLDLAGLPYTGSGILASALGMNKIMFRKILKQAKIPIPKYVSLRRGDDINKVSKILGKPPYFVKPYNQGSSVGASIVNKKNELKKALSRAFHFSDIALVDEYLRGIEITSGIIGNESLLALPLIEIHPLKGEFFNYDSKYLESGAEEIVPARINKKLTQKVKKIAKRVYREIGCKGFARVDFILKNGKDPYVLEINTIPGLTPMSLLPKAAKAYGFSYPNLLDKIISYALK